MAPSISRIANSESSPNHEGERPVQHQNTFASALDLVQQLYHSVVLPPVPSRGSESDDEISPSTPILPGSYPKSESSSPTTDVRLELPASPSAFDGAKHNHEACATATQDRSPPSRTPSTAPGVPISAATIENMGSALQGAHNFTVRDHARITNMVGVNNVTNYGGTIDLDVMKKFMEDFVSFNAVHDSPVQDPTRQCHPETRKAILKQLQDWIDGPDEAEPGIFWLHGPAGVGKSAIAQTIACSYSRDKVPATFFFYRSDPSRNDGNRLFTTLAWQLALSIPGYKTHLIHSLNERPDLPRKDVETQFEELIVRPLRALNKVSSQTPLPIPVIIIDGIDECLNEQLQRRILKIIGSAISDRRVPLRFLICSRPEAHIQEIIDNSQCPTLPLDLAKLDDANKDIETYLKAEFSRIASEQDLDPSWPGEEIIQKFVHKSSGQFIYASTLIRFIDDEYSLATAQLDIVLGLKASEVKKPFAELDALYKEILKRQPDWNFLDDVLSLFISSLFSSFGPTTIKNCTILINLSEKELCRKLRGMRSLLKLDPGIEVYHRSFLDFLQDPSRSDQYNISQKAGDRRSLDIITSSIVRYVHIVLEQPDCHEQHFFLWIQLKKSVLSAEDLEVLQPLVQIQDKLLGMEISWQRLLLCNKCNVLYIIRGLLVYLTCRQEAAKHKVAHPFRVVERGITEHAGPFGPLTPFVQATEVEQSVLERSDLDDNISSLLVQLRETKLELPLGPRIIDLMCSLLRFDYAETAIRVHSFSDGQLLVDIIDYLINNGDALSQHCTAILRRAARLSLEIHARIPILPRSMFCPSEITSTSEITWTSWTSWISDFAKESNYIWYPLMAQFTPMFMARTLDSNYVLRVLWTIKEGTFTFVYDCMNTCEPISEWRRSNPDLNMVLQVMLEAAKAIQYVDSMDILLKFDPNQIFLDSEHHVKILPLGLVLSMTCLSSEELHQSNIFTLGCIFYELYFKVQLYSLKSRTSYKFKDDMIQGPERPSEPEIRDELWHLIQRCYAADPQSRPSIHEVVQEMESWKLD